MGNSMVEIKGIQRRIYLRFLRWRIVMRSHPYRTAIASAVLIFVGMLAAYWRYFYKSVPMWSTRFGNSVLHFSQGHPHLSRILHIAMNAVPDAVPLFLGLAGLVYLMPNLAKRIEDTKPLRVGVAALCILFMLLAIAVNAINREAQDHKSEGQDLRMTSVESTNSQILRAVLGPTPDVSEPARRKRILDVLRNEYILSHDPIDPDILAGTKSPPDAWTSSRLKELGEKWTVDTTKASVSITQQASAPEHARLVLSLWDNRATIDSPIVAKYIARNSDGNYLVEFAVGNPSDVAAESPEIWLTICDACSFVENPQGFDRPIGMQERTRHKSWPLLNPGASTERLTALVKLEENSSFQVGLRYSCKSCGLPKGYQMATLTPLGGVPTRTFKLHSSSTFYIPKPGHQ